MSIYAKYRALHWYLTYLEYILLATHQGRTESRLLRQTTSARPSAVCLSASCFYPYVLLRLREEGKFNNPSRNPCMPARNVTKLEYISDNFDVNLVQIKEQCSNLHPGRVPLPPPALPRPPLQSRARLRSVLWAKPNVLWPKVPSPKRGTQICCYSMYPMSLNQ